MCIRDRIDLERVGDMAEDIARYALDRIDREIPFSDEAQSDLAQLSRFAHTIYTRSLRAFSDNDPVLALEVCTAESEFDALYWQIRDLHIGRVEAGQCHPEANVIFTETDVYKRQLPHRLHPRRAADGRAGGRRHHRPADGDEQGAGGVWGGGCGGGRSAGGQR